MAKGKNKAAREGLHGSVTHLLHRALQLALDYHAEAAGQDNLTQRQYTVLAAAAAHEGLTQNDLVRSTGIDRSTLADLVARLLNRGLLERERSATDARANSVRLTEAGRTALAQGSGAVEEADDRLLALLSPKKRESLLKSLAVLAAEADGAASAAKSKGKAGRKAKGEKAKKAARKAAAPEEVRAETVSA